jgi:hypothetical protein
MCGVASGASRRRAPRECASEYLPVRVVGRRYSSECEHLQLDELYVVAKESGGYAADR